MSARARVKLCSGLAKIGWLSKRKFQAIFPRIKRISGESGAEDIAIYRNGVLVRSRFLDGENCDIPAGEELEARWVAGSRDWRIKIFFDNGKSVVIGGRCGGVGPGLILTNGAYADRLFSRFLTPLDGQNWYYTAELQQAFGLLRNNENVGTYPNCRRWSKD